MAREMKDSGVEWIGEIPKEWAVRKVKHYYKLQTGFTPDTKKEYYYDNENGYAWVNISDIKGNQPITETKNKISKRYVDEFAPQYIPKGSLMYSFKLSVGLTAFAGKPLFSNEAIAAFIPDKNVNLNFLHYSSFMIKENAEINIYNARILNQERIKNALIVFPPLSEQEKIATFLDTECSRIDSVIEQTRASIEEYKKLKQAVITQAVTKGIRPNREMKDSGIEWIGTIPEEWSIRPLKAYIDILPGYAFSSNDFNSEKGIPLLRGINVAPNVIRWDETVFWNQPITEQIKPFELCENDLVVGLDRPWITEGTRVAFITKKDLPCLLLQRVCRIRSKGNIDIRFVYHTIAGRMFEEALATDTTGVSVPHISTKQIQNFVVSVPSLSEQTEICDYLDRMCAEIDKLIDRKNNLLSELESYKKSLIFEYVTGKKEVPA